MSLDKKVVVITGASQGIGRATALRCAEAGAIVGANYFKSTTAAETLLAAAPDQIHLLPFDVRDPEEVKSALSAFIQKHGRIDVLINNAGIMAAPLVRDKRGYES